MKFKRMAVVAAAAVVGPTVLAATPAMAQEKAAVTVPDAAPKDEAAGTGAPDQSKPSADRQAAPKAPAANTGQTNAAGTRAVTAGPKVSTQNVPKSFAPGGSPTQLTVTVDNRGGTALASYVPAVGISQYDGIVKPEHIKAERRLANGTWQPVALRLDRGQTVYEVELGERTVAQDEVYTVDVRIAFTVNTPAAPLELYVGGEGRGQDGNSVTSRYTWFDSVVGKAGETGGGEETPAFTGPKLGLQGLPRDGFQAGSDWREFSMRVDNTGHEAIDDYQLDLTLWVENGFLKQGDTELEVYAPDRTGSWSWQPVLSDGSEEVWTHEVASVDIKKNEAFDLKLRMRFDRNTQPHEISLRTSGQNGWGEGSVHSQDASHSSFIAHGHPDHVFTEGPQLSVAGFPQDGFTAGGGWHTLTARVDNTGKKALRQFDASLRMYRPDAARWTPSQVTAEVYAKDANGTWSWQPLKTGDGGETLLGIGFGSRPVAAGEVYEVQFRLRFAADTPSGEIVFQMGGSEPEGSPDETIESESPEYRTKISSKTGTGTGTGTEGNTPKPNGGSTPADGSNGTGTGGELAETGADAATAWALGGGGAVLALGAALVAGTGRHRRRTV
ncbi:hypothetical protein AB0D45_00720 [Streptomyces sp. NPDC048352]|uniref:hypothetical protein n=1 Tax=Streptomyces sp. NPDC048352 TaxID=3154718 RepID=UPI0034475943